MVIVNLRLSASISIMASKLDSLSLMMPPNLIGHSRMHGVLNVKLLLSSKVVGIIFQRLLLKSILYAKAAMKKLGSAMFSETHNKYVNERTSCWTAKSAASQQRGPLQRRYVFKEISCQLHG